MATFLLLLLGLGAAAAQTYPLVAKAADCTIPDQAGNWTTLSLISAASWLTSIEGQQALNVSEACVGTATGALVPCIADLTKLEGCCDPPCASSLQFILNQPTSAGCVDELFRGLCNVLATPGTVTTQQAQQLTDIFLAITSGLRRCIWGYQYSCSATSPPTAVVSSPPPAVADVSSPPPAVADVSSPPPAVARMTAPATCMAVVMAVFFMMMLLA